VWGLYHDVWKQWSWTSLKSVSQHLSVLSVRITGHAADRAPDRPVLQDSSTPSVFLECLFEKPVAIFLQCCDAMFGAGGEGGQLQKVIHIHSGLGGGGSTNSSCPLAHLHLAFPLLLPAFCLCTDFKTERTSLLCEEAL
jgi:hypothetical protein